MAIVNWTLKAQAALDNIYDYIHLDAPYYAGNFVQQIVDAADTLEIFPLGGRAVPEAEQNDIREIIYKNYRIIYRVISEEHLDVLTVLPDRVDLADPKNQPWIH
jgi:toxin ParE1/3/4